MQRTTEQLFTREDFMAFFRNTEQLNQLTVDDRIEVFSTILLGSSDFKKQLFDDLFSDYCIAHLEVIAVEPSTSSSLFR